MVQYQGILNVIASPSLGREWIEMSDLRTCTSLKLSPSLGREWIEIDEYENQMHAEFGLPPWGGSGLKFAVEGGTLMLFSLPPWGGSGLKSMELLNSCGRGGSPSLGREWIEIALRAINKHSQ